jgi:DNA-directed RNA polymerase subunit L
MSITITESKKMSSEIFFIIVVVLPTVTIFILMNTCLNCKTSIESNRKFCSSKCNGNYTQQQSIEKWLSGTLSGHKGKVKNIKPFVREYLFKKYNNSCCKCGWNTPHPISGNPPLEVNHIDGDHENTIESNLELICPNCHSLTLNFKNRNKGNGRFNRKERYAKGLSY